MHRPTFWNRRIIRCASRTVIHLSLSRSRVLDHCQLPSIEPKREPHSSLLIQRVMLCLSTFCFPTFCFSALSPSFFYQFFHSPECIFPVVLLFLFFLMAYEMEFVQRKTKTVNIVFGERGRLGLLFTLELWTFAMYLIRYILILLVEIKITDENKQVGICNRVFVLIKMSSDIVRIVLVWL